MNLTIKVHNCDDSASSAPFMWFNKVGHACLLKIMDRIRNSIGNVRDGEQMLKEEHCFHFFFTRMNQAGLIKS